MLREICVYLWALVCNGAGIIWGAELAWLLVTLMLSQEQYLKVTNFLDRYIEEASRLLWSRRLLFAAVIVAGFLAWNDQYQIAITKTPTALDDRVSKLEGKVDAMGANIQTISSNYQPLLQASAERIPTEAQGTNALRKKTFTLAFNMLSFAANAEKRLPTIPQPRLPPDRSSEYDTQVLNYERSEASQFVAQNKAELELVLKGLKANGVLNQPEEIFTELFTFNDMRVAASELASAANRLPAQ
jgi:hypothetical protein